MYLPAIYAGERLGELGTTMLRSELSPCCGGGEHERIQTILPCACYRHCIHHPFHG